MTGLITDSNTRHRSVDLVDAGHIERLIKDRAKRLNEDRGNLTDRLERFIMHSATHHWTPPKHPSYNLIDAGLKSFDKWPKLGEFPSPESLSDAGFFYEGMYIVFYKILTYKFYHYFTYIKLYHYRTI